MRNEYHDALVLLAMIAARQLEVEIATDTTIGRYNSTPYDLRSALDKAMLALPAPAATPPDGGTKP